MSQSNDTKHAANAEEILKRAHFETDDGNVTLEAADNGDEQYDTADEVSDLQAQLAQAHAQLAEGRDALLRMQADMENQRRRNDKQVEDTHKFAVQRFVESLLPVVDSLEMGMQTQGDIESIREGMKLTLQQFEAALGKFKIEAIQPVNQSFNPEHHQAVSMFNSPQHEDGMVVEVLQKGYSLSGRVVRPAMVVVCKK